jgi:MFS family permease
VADHLSRTSSRRSLAFISLTVLLTTIPFALMFLSGSWLVAILLFVVPACTSNVYLAPVLALSQGLVSLRMRALTSALALLIINVIGLLFGPQVTGLLSTALQPHFGEESIRYALLIVATIFLPWAAFHYHRAAKTIDDDLAGAAEND